MAHSRRSAVAPWLLSGLIHAGLAGALLVWAVSRDWPGHQFKVATAVRPASAEAADDLSLAELSGDELPAGIQPPAAPAMDALADADPSDSQLAAFTRQKLESARKDAEQRPFDEQVAELEVLAERLNRVSSQESVTAVTDTIAPWIGSGSRASEPVASAGDAEPFDVETGQIFDVHRSGEDGAFEYVAILLDAGGRTQELPLDEADGAELYDLFQMIKKFPLLETVYRKAVLGLLDTIMADERAASAKASSNEVDGGERDAQQNTQSDEKGKN